MKLLIVVDKLLTGFDAPPCSYLYIDKSMQDHGLFQAICRTNRLDGEDKDFGRIVDYKDLFKKLVNDKGTGVNYFLTYDINPFAPVYRDLNNNGVQDPGETVTLGALINSATSFAVLTPKLVTLANVPPLTTKTAGILEYSDAVLFTPDDSIAPASATQGDKDVPILKFTLKTPVSFASVSSIKVGRIGQGSIQTQGSNDDIAQVKVYRDANFNGVLDPTVDVLIGTGTFAQPDPNGTGAKTTTVTIVATADPRPTCDFWKKFRYV